MDVVLFLQGANVSLVYVVFRNARQASPPKYCHVEMEHLASAVMSLNVSMK